MDTLTFFQQCINGLSLGGMYALIAIGYTMVYGCLRLINFAHADIMMVGAFLVFFAVSAFGIPFYVSAILAVVLCGILGMLIDKIAYTPLRNAPRISMLITAIGVSFFLENVFNVLFGSTPRFFSAPDFFMQSIALFGVSLCKTPFENEVFSNENEVSYFYFVFICRIYFVFICRF